MSAATEAQLADSRARGTLPLFRELSPFPQPVDALRRFADLDGTILFHSSERRVALGRYSFLAADPFRWFRVGRAEYGVDPLAPIEEFLAPFVSAPVPELPPFQGGAAGMLGYELGEAWERIPPRGGEGGPPVLAVGIYDWVVAWDHEQDRAWVVSQGYPETDQESRTARASARLENVIERLRGPVPSGNGTARSTMPLRERRAGLPAPVSSDFSREEYLGAVGRIVEYIRVGDAFQVNLSQRLDLRAADAPAELYARLAVVNPAPFAGYFAAEDWAVVSASPERFLKVSDGKVETRPIKGTRPRSRDRDEDRRRAEELLTSEKDRAENVMIVDLLRNDLSRVCRAGSVKVSELCSLESYETVHHLVSAITGTLDEGRSVWDLLRASFPGGSITGAPKVRAMEIVRELEPSPRGPYCGSLFYVGFDGAADSSILIRTAVVKGERVRIGVGGGVTAISDPEAEYEETLDKAAGILRALGAISTAGGSAE